MLKMAIYRSHVWPAFMFERGVRCVKENEWNLTKNVDIHCESNVWCTVNRMEKNQGIYEDVCLQ